MIIFGHRGAPGLPRYGENTIASFMKALQKGAGGVEFDIRRCGDGQIVVIHDATIDRTTNGKGRVADFSYSELKQFDAGFGEPIPLLSDVLDTLGGRCILNIELKEPGLVTTLRALVKIRRLEKEVIVSSFVWGQLESLAPDIPIALLASEASDAIIPAARRLGAAAIHPRTGIASPELITAAHESNLKVHVWTVNDPAQIRHFRELGVDGIFTDFVEPCSTSAS